MSGTLGTVLSAIGTARQLVSLFNGGVLTLGSMTFTGFEVPERIQLGGQQQITTHKLPGGARVLDATGNDPAPITWSGLFLGPLATARSIQLDAIRRQQRPVHLAWGDVSASVVISDTTFDSKDAGAAKQITYRVTCIVVPDVPEPTDFGTGATPDTPLAASDSSASAFDAAGTTITATDTGAMADLATAQTAAQATDAFTTGSAASLTLATATSSLSTTLGGMISAGTSALATVGSITPTALLATVDGAGLLARGTAALSLVQGVQTTLARL